MATTKRAEENAKKAENAKINHRDMIRRVEIQMETERVQYLKEFEVR